MGFVASVARPGGNLTGLSNTVGPELFGKQLEILNKTVPKVTRVAVVANPTNGSSPEHLEATRAAAQALGLTLVALQVKEVSAIDGAFAAMKQEHAGALTVLPDALLVGQRIKIADPAVKHRLPAIYGITEHVEAGGLMAYAVNRFEIFRRAASMWTKY